MKVQQLTRLLASPRTPKLPTSVHLQATPVKVPAAEMLWDGQWQLHLPCREYLYMCAIYIYIYICMQTSVVFFCLLNSVCDYIDVVYKYINKQINKISK